jgi:hypothetical protein
MLDEHDMTVPSHPRTPLGLATTPGLPQVTELMQLAAGEGEARLSMFLPLAPAGVNRGRSRARGRRLLRRAGHELRRGGVSTAQTTLLIEAAEDALVGVERMHPSTAGIALFAGEETVRHFAVPVRVPELVVLGQRFTVGPLMPLLPMLTSNPTFFVLALDPQEVRLFKGDPFGIEEVDLGGHQLEAWRTMPPPRPSQVHAFVADRGGAGNHAVFHGGGGNAVDDRKHRLRNHFRGVDRALREVLPQTNAPLVVAAPRHMRALYAEVNTYPHVLDDGVDGNPRHQDADALHRRAWPLVEPVLRRAEARAVEDYHELAGTGLTVSSPMAALTAAEQGRVASLLLPAARCTWRDFPQHHGIGWLTDPGSLEEQLERSALATLHSGGDVFIVPPERMPGDATVAAVLRY